MPTNLNALIRYKQIDSCLKNNRYGCSIFDLIEACSDALAEFRGTKKRISERTIRDDIRVLRSEILGFNAPIIFDEGVYLYDNPDFNIFKKPIIELDILHEVYNLLKEKKEELEEKAVDSILMRIKNVLGDAAEGETVEDIPMKSIKISNKELIEDPIEEDKNEPSASDLEEIDKLLSDDKVFNQMKEKDLHLVKYNLNISNDYDNIFMSIPPIETKTDKVLLWEDIFKLI